MKTIKKFSSITSLFLLMLLSSCSSDDNDNNQQTCLANSFEFISTSTTVQISSNIVSIAFDVTNNSSSDFDLSEGSQQLQYTIVTTTEEGSTVETNRVLPLDLLPAMSTGSVQLSADFAPGETYQTFQLSISCI